MITYNKIASREDKKFMRVARKVLKGDFVVAVDEASEAFQKAYAVGTVSRRVNDARRAANLIVLRWMREFGISNWKDLDAPPVRRKPTQSARENFVDPKVINREYAGGTGLWTKKL